MIAFCLLNFQNTKIHFSVDDCSECFSELSDTSRSSIFDFKYWCFYKKLHDYFGCKVTLYAYSESIRPDIIKRFQQDFIDNSDWLKIGFHAVSSNMTDSIRMCMIDAFYSNMMECTSRETLPQTLRLHYFKADSSVVHFLINKGAKMLLCADDKRVNYDLSYAENEELIKKEILLKNEIEYIPTDLRIEKTRIIFPALLKNNKEQHLVIFTHEWALNRTVKLKAYIMCLIFKIKKATYIA